MDFLNRAQAQLTDLYQSMTPGARITAGLLLAVVLVSLAYLFNYQVSGAGGYLMGGESFPPSHLGAMEAAFDKAGLSSYELEGSKIRVPQGQQSRYMGALADAKALPPNFNTYLDQAAGGGGPFDSRQQLEQRAKIAKQKLLSLIVSSMTGVEKAVVVFDKETKRGFSRATLNTGAVYVWPLGSQQLEETQVSAIRDVLTGSIAGLKSEDVTITDCVNNRSFRGGSADGGSPLDNVYASLKQMYERRWKSKILEVLNYVPGVTVTLDVELNTQRRSQTEKVEHDPKPIAIFTSETSRSRSQDGNRPSGRPGYASQQPMALPAASSKGTHQEEEQTESTTKNVVSSERIVSEDSGLTPKRVTASVAIPTSYLEQVWHKKNPTPADQEPKTPEQSELDQVSTEVVDIIKKTVAGVLPKVEGVTDLTELVTVTTFPDIKPPEVPQPGFADNILAWLGQSWSTLGMIGLALFSLVMLRSMIRAAPATSVQPQHHTATAPAGETEEETEPETPAAHRLGRFSGSGPSLRDELAELVQEDPDAAANILRTWIGSPT